MERVAERALGLGAMSGAQPIAAGPRARGLGGRERVGVLAEADHRPDPAELAADLDHRRPVPGVRL
ncbi:MAG: hypothetical protein H6710_19050 [Myxococcales bacterium]|nr:hypothetical protein [Myxococcales bacterium]